MSIEEVKRINEQGLAAWDQHNADGFAALCDESIVFNDVSLPEPIKGKERVRQYVQSWMTAFPDMHMRTKKAVVAEDTIATELEWEGTHRGPLQGPPGTPTIAPTGKRVVGKGAYFARVRNGKIVEFSAHPDTVGMMTQLGLMPTGTGGGQAGTSGGQRR